MTDEERQELIEAARLGIALLHNAVKFMLYTWTKYDKVDGGADLLCEVFPQGVVALSLDEWEAELSDLKEELLNKE